MFDRTIGIRISHNCSVPDCTRYTAFVSTEQTKLQGRNGDNIGYYWGGCGAFQLFQDFKIYTPPLEKRNRHYCESNPPFNCCRYKVRVQSSKWQKHIGYLYSGCRQFVSLQEYEQRQREMPVMPLIKA
ncbi:MAG: hypothetical protein JRN52_02055 [Nitrososphaerota archaeon]|nr:hypothetical protein [Nitrososphaerota archaeon]